MHGNLDGNAKGAKSRESGTAGQECKGGAQENLVLTVTRLRPPCLAAYSASSAARTRSEAPPPRGTPLATPIDTVVPSVADSTACRMASATANAAAASAPGITTMNSSPP